MRGSISYIAKRYSEINEKNLLCIGMQITYMVEQ